MISRSIVGLITLGGAAILAACRFNEGGLPLSDGGLDTDATGADGDVDPMQKPPGTRMDDGLEPDEGVGPAPDAGIPEETTAHDKALYVSRGFRPSDGASGMVYDSGSRTTSTLPHELAFRVNSLFRTHPPSQTSGGRACELATSGGENLGYNSYIRCFEENEEGAMESTWDDRGDGLAPGGIVGGRMILGRNAGPGDMAVRSFDDGDWGYFPLYDLGEVLAMTLASAGEETYIPVRDHGCMGPTAAVEAGGMIFTLAEAADGTGRVCVIDPAFDEIDQDGEIALATSYPKMGVAVGNKILVVARGVELFNTDTRASEGLLWDSAALCAGIEGCASALPLHISVSEGLGMGAVTFMYPGASIEDMEYRVRTFTIPSDETGTFELGGVIYSRSRASGSPDGIEGTAFMNGGTIFMTHRWGSAEYDIETGTVSEVSTVGADGRFPTQAPVVLSASGDEE